MIKKANTTNNDSIRRSLNNAGMESSDGGLQTKFNLDVKTSGLSKITEATLYQDICQDFYELLIELPLSETDYLQKRGINEDVIQKMKLKYIDEPFKVQEDLKSKYSTEILKSCRFLDKNNHLTFTEHQLIFPYIKQGKPIYFKGRNVKNQYHLKEISLFKPEPLLYNIDIISESPKTVIICQSITDSLTLIRHNIPTVAISDYDAFRDEWFDLFRQIHARIAFNSTMNGQNKSFELMHRFHENKIDVSRIILHNIYDVNKLFMTVEEFYQ